MKTQWIVLVVVAGTWICSGCQSLTQSGLATRTMFPNRAEVSDEPGRVESIPVSIRPSHGQPVLREIPYREGMRLQEIVDASKVRFHQRKIHIVRTSPQTGQKHRLEANFNGSEISFETDYAIHPGDKVVVQQDDTSAFDRVMMNMLGRT